MRVHYKGIIPILVILALELAILAVINLIFPVHSWVHYFLYGLGFTFFIAVVLFFRHPKRIVAVDENSVLSAADGRIVVIEEVMETKYFNDKRMQVSVFMSPLNVHVNWYPVSGEIIHTKYIRGRYHPAYVPKASEENERQIVVIRNNQGIEIMMVQIAGVMARRVFTNAKEGNYVFQGEEAGIIKFGSRVDLFLPVDADINIDLHQHVTACSTVIATFPQK
jgi:phosphatidylserine decarboxylase